MGFEKHLSMSNRESIVDNDIDIDIDLCINASIPDITNGNGDMYNSPEDHRHRTLGYGERLNLAHAIASYPVAHDLTSSSGSNLSSFNASVNLNEPKDYEDPTGSANMKHGTPPKQHSFKVSSTSYNAYAASTPVSTLTKTKSDVRSPPFVLSSSPLGMSHRVGSNAALHSIRGNGTDAVDVTMEMTKRIELGSGFRSESSPGTISLVSPSPLSSLSSLQSAPNSPAPNQIIRSASFFEAYCQAQEQANSRRTSVVTLPLDYQVNVVAIANSFSPSSKK